MSLESQSNIHPLDNLILTNGQPQSVDSFPVVPIDGEVYFTPKTIARGTEAWRKLSVDDQLGQLDRRIVLLKNVGMALTGHAQRLQDRSDQLYEETMTDTLTGLQNRRAFTAKLAERVIKDEGKFVVMFIDLDRFKEVNDTLGHDKGDTVLRNVADKVQSVVHLREGDDIFRLGGDEFVVIARTDNTQNSQRNKDITEKVAIDGLEKRIISVVEEAAVLSGAPFVSASIGTERHIKGETPEKLLERADLKMYAVKAERKAARTLGKQF